jgi:hypothetical protein
MEEQCGTSRRQCNTCVAVVARAARDGSNVLRVAEREPGDKLDNFS